MQPRGRATELRRAPCHAFTLWCAVAVAVTGFACGDYAAEPETIPGDYPTFLPDEPQPASRESDAPAPPADERTVAQGPDEWIAADVDLGDPREVTELTVRIRVDGGYRLPSGPNHHVDADAYGVQRLLVRAAPGARVDPDERREALVASDVYDVDDPALQAAAARAILGDRNDRERVDSLVHWVYGNVSYVLGHADRASDVLARREGDCSEKAMLFVAMARAVRIPARRVVGLAFTYADGKPAFGYHAWAEAAIDGRWVPVDPTWDETVADATHIRLLEGDGDAWGAAAGRIQLWIADVSREPGAGELDAESIAAELPAHMLLRFRQP
jgi:transglutaminase-like putative cysteine protease